MHIGTCPSMRTHSTVYTHRNPVPKFKLVGFREAAPSIAACTSTRALEYNYFARINSLPPPLQGTTPPSRRPHPSPHPSPQSLETDPPSPSSAAQTDPSFRLHIGPPPLLLRSFGFFLASFPYNFQLSALRRGNIYTTFPTNDPLGAWPACNPGALLESVTFIHSFTFFGSILPPIFLCLRFGKGKERKGDF